MKICYQEKRLSSGSLKLVAIANQIIDVYRKQGYDLTLRQLYYQFVARDIIANKQSEYKRLGSIINDARLAGLISWKSIVDRTRNLEKNPHWENPAQFMDSVIPQFQTDRWENQPRRVEVWIEKDALLGVIENVCKRNDVSYFSCRGNTSQSEMWAAGMRLKDYQDLGQEPVIIHLGDHDPSGIDMTRDIEDRLTMFAELPIEVNRIALNMPQIVKYNPPPNPAKKTDSRYKKYAEQYGEESWELDALEPRILEALIERTILEYRDENLWNETIEKEEGYTGTLKTMAKKLKKAKK